MNITSFSPPLLRYQKLKMTEPKQTYENRREIGRATWYSGKTYEEALIMECDLKAEGDDFPEMYWDMFLKKPNQDSKRFVYGWSVMKDEVIK